MEDALLKEIISKNGTKIVLVVADGLGGLPSAETGLTELETACTPNLDRLAKRGSAGLSVPVGYGVTPGSGPSHLALFGYDPTQNRIGRGVLEASGIDFDLQPEDLAARGNFATLKDGLIVDRRAGRISTEENQRLCAILSKEIKEIDGVKIIIRTVKEHRFVVIFRGKEMVEGLSENDPEKEGLAPLRIESLRNESRFAADIAHKFIYGVTEVLKAEKANYPLLRGFAKKPSLPSFDQKYFLRAAAIASYPMYRGLARLAGMEVLLTGEKISDELETLKKNFQDFDFFYIHIKKTDSYGEDGNFAAKVKVIEEVDSAVGEIEKMQPDVIAVTADHSTPALLRGHSWHPNPFLLISRYAMPDNLSGFSERECRKGSFGAFPATEIMPLLLAHSLRLRKFGA
ncbi:MAG: 2,3-bisphosphoglycerate-independent phosphoglycerate mutase [Candidatus Omnitrophota bacterium]|nr:2,3-bisphosphoglycerate-independent phosphoglycerate mutase [Candidatus Omnitrophota bacterium]